MVFGIRLTPEQEERLSELARTQGCSRSACVRQALDDYLLLHGGNTHLAAQTAEEAWREQVPDWASQLMVDKLFTVSMTALGNEMGQLEPALLHALDQARRGWLGLI